MLFSILFFFRLVSSQCNWGYYQNPSSGPSCLPCNKACGSCYGPTEYQCSQCSSTYSSINGICFPRCPLGFSNNANTCTSSAGAVAYSLDFTQLTNTVSETVGVSASKIVLNCGSSTNYYPSYDKNDPYTIQYRGFYFNGAAYFSNAATEVTFGPVFTIASWIRPVSGEGYLFAKQSSSNILVAIQLSGFKPVFRFYISSDQSFQSSKSLSADVWVFLMTKMKLNNFQGVASITVNQFTETSSSYSTYYSDQYSSFTTTYGAQVSSSVYSGFYKGYMWSFKMGNQDIDASTFIQTSSCQGCSLCPADNSNNCISTCNYLQYIKDGACVDCTSSCQTFGCVRSDISCNLCQDKICLNCANFGAGCTLCRANAYLQSSTQCVCNNGYIWDDTSEKCLSCVDNCKTCDGGGYLGCSECKAGFYMLSGICYSFCPTGYKVSGTSCVLNGSARIMDMFFNKVLGVVYDSINSIPAVTGSTSAFYPNYETNDPIAAYSRGYYFTGKSVLNYAPYSTYTSPFLIFSSMFYVGIWFNPGVSSGILFSSVKSDYSTILQFSIQNLKPSIAVGLYNADNHAFNYPSVSVSSTVSLNSWSYVVFSFYLSKKAVTDVTCYLNGQTISNTILGQGYLLDNNNGNIMIAGTQATSSSAYNSAFYTGFIYRIIVDVDTLTPSSEYYTSCPSGCSSCPSPQVCLSPCNLNQYPSASNTCSNCDSSCKSGCRDSSASCNICGDPGCVVCSSFDYSDCSVYSCPNGKYLDTASGNCLSCDLTCATCVGSGPASCLSCSTGYLLNKACVSLCPTGYSSNNNMCIQNLDAVLNLDFSMIKGIVPDNNYQIIAGNNAKFYPNFDENDPWPQINRGYYFNGNSYLQLPPNSLDSSLLVFGNAFSFEFWLRSESDGSLFSKISSSAEYYLNIVISSSAVSVSLKLSQYSTAKTSNTLTAGWDYVLISVQYVNPGTSSVFFVVNKNTQQVSAGSGSFADISSGFFLTIAADKKNSVFSNYWKGGLYSFTVYSSYHSQPTYSTTCASYSSVCQICPKSICIDSCPTNTWFDGSTCKACQSSSYKSCRRNDKKCNLCHDVACLVCSDWGSGSCTQCIANADLNNGKCQCSNGYIWDPKSETCAVCGSGNVQLQGVCLSQCPTGYSPNAGKCEGNGGKIVNTQLDKGIQGVIVDGTSGISFMTGPTSAFYPYYDSEDPYAGKDRGYYFNGKTSYIQTTGSPSLVLSPKFSIGFWVYPESAGVLFSKKYNNEIGIVIQITSALNIGVSATLSQGGLSNVVSKGQVKLNSWNFVGVTFTVNSDLSTSTSIQINTVQESLYLGSFPFVDSSSFNGVFGAQVNSAGSFSDYFSGFIQSVQVWNYDFNLNSQASTACSGCSICPASGSCFPSCGIGFYFDTTCLPCSSKCSQGCVRAEDCNLCYDRLCETCSDFTVNGCKKCVDGASLVNGVCQCKSGTAMTRPNGNFYCATTCNTQCASCYSGLNGDCLTCNKGFFLDNGLCLTQCQTGSTIKNSGCEFTQKKEILHYVFNQTINNPPDLTQKLKAFMGSSENYIGNFDQNDPIPYYSNGIYFNGNSKYVQIPPNPVQSESIVLGNTHSIKLWLKPDQSASGCLLVKESSVRYVYIYLNTVLSLFVDYAVTDIYSNTLNVLTATGPGLSVSLWAEVVIVFTRNNLASSAVVYVNGVKGTTAYLAQSFLNEPQDVYFKLGYSQTASSSFSGFVYEIVVFNYVVSPASPSSYPCYCSLCTASGDCLNQCGTNQYQKPDFSCSNCPNNCTDNCRSASVCGQNSDPLCFNYTGFQSSQCVSCSPLASLTPTGCKCVAFSTLSNSKCSCVENYEGFNNECVKCFSHLQSANIAGYFSRDYYSVIFNLTQPVQKPSSDCSVLFTGSTLEQLGYAPTCVWGQNYTVLTVTLGYNAKVLNGSQVWFAANTLLTYQQVCGINRGPVNQSVWFVYDVPLIKPTSVISAPFEYYINCGNLKISGFKSIGGYGRDLKYLWSFTSNPLLSVFNISNLDKVDVVFFNNSLNATKLTVSLTVLNWLGYNNTSSQSIEVVSGRGIVLDVDQSISYVMTTQMSKSIFVQAMSQCLVSNNLTFNWTLLSSSGKDSVIYQQLLWSSQKSQNKLFIPKGSLGPGSYVFQVAVQDNVYQSKGKANIFILVEYSDLVVNFNPGFKTVSNEFDLVLDGSAAYDPDQTRDDMTYQWACVGPPNCSVSIQDPTSGTAKVVKSFLQDKTEYNFSLTVSKSPRTASGFLTVFINSSNTQSVSFSPVSRYINNQENFVIISSINPPCDCIYQWDITGGPYLLSTSNSSKDLGITPYSLTPGSVYTASLTVTGKDKSVSVFKQSFTVAVPPKGGSLICGTPEGFAQVTWFDLTAAGFQDSQNASNPLLYQFGYYRENQTFYLNIKNETLVYSTRLPFGSPLRVFVRVYDIYGSYSEETLDLNVKSIDLNISSVVQDFKLAVSADWMDTDQLAGYLSNVAWVLSDSGNNSYNGLAFNLSLIALRKLRDSLQDVDFSKIDVLLRLTGVISLYDLDYEDRLLIYTMLSSITQIISDNKVIMSGSRAETYTQVLLKISNLNQTMAATQVQDLGLVNEILKSLAFASSLTMAQTQEILYGQAPVAGYFKLYQGDQVPGFKAPSELNNSYVSLPDISNKTRYLSSQTILTILNVYNSDNLSYNSTSEQSAVVEFLLVEIVNGTHSQIDLSLDEKLVNISIPVWNLAEYPPKCVYFDTPGWSTKGCKLLTHSNNKSVCGCSHTSLYSSGSLFNLASDDDKNGGPIVIYIVCFVAFIWVLLAAFLLIKDRKEAESKIFVNKILAALPETTKKRPVYLKNEIADQLGKGFPVGQTDVGVKSSLEEEKEPESKQNKSSTYKGYQILPVSLPLEAAVKEESFQPQSVSFKPKFKSSEMPESEKAAGFSQEKKELSSIEIEEEIDKVKALPSSLFKSENSNSSNRLNMGVIEDRAQTSAYSFNKIQGFDDKQKTGFSDSFGSPTVPKVLTFDVIKMNNEESSSKEPKEFDLKTPEVNDRMYDGKNLSYAKSSSFKLAEFEPRPQTDGKFLVDGLGLTGTNSQNKFDKIDEKIETGSSSNQSNATGPRFQFQIEPEEERAGPYFKGFAAPPRLPGLVEMKYEDSFKKTEVLKNSSDFPSGVPVEVVEAETKQEQKGILDGKRVSAKLQVPEKGSTVEVKVSQSSRKIQPYEENLFNNNLEEVKLQVKPQERYPENTELFTQPDSPANRRLARRKKADNQEAPMFDEHIIISYSPYTANYFVSAVFFYHENYSRFSRCAQAVCSFLLQSLFIGLIISGMGEAHADNKGSTVSSQVDNLLFQDVAIAFSMVLICNFVMGVFLCVVYRRVSAKEMRKKEFVGFVVIVVIVVGTVVGVGFVEMAMKHTGSILWAICLFIAFVFDLVVIQMIKVAVYGYFAPFLIFPV